MTVQEPVKRANKYARLLSIGEGGISDSSTDTGGSSPVIIDFPSMPETIDLVRNSKYIVETPPNVPDGIHVFHFTEPMKIPISFKISSYDSFAPQGGLTLLYIASKLHALALPIGIDNINNAKAQALNTGDPATPKKTDAALGNTPSGTGTEPTPAKTTGLKLPAWPAVCFLNLITITNSLRGISCIGYVENVSVKLKGPFLSADDGSFNIPSSGEFSFTFVHAPGYRNKPFRNIANTAASAYAGDVLSNLYNTYALSQKQKGGIQPIIRV